MMKTNKMITLLSCAAVTTSVLAACGGPQPLPFAAQMPQAQFQAFNAAGDGSTIVPGKVIVKFKPGAQMAAANLSRSIRAQKVNSVGHPGAGIDVLKLQPGQSVNATIAELQKNPAVEYAEPVFTMPFPRVQRSAPDLSPLVPSNFPNDPMFSKQYAHQVTQSQQGWSLHQGDRKIVIGIVDSGVDITHPDLKDKIVGVYNGADNNDDVKDHVGHGTHVAGIAAAITNNGLGVAGVAPDCKILAVKVSSGDSGGPSTDGIANGIIWAADHGADVINLSLGGRRQSMAITDAVNHALSKNVVVVVASGNDGGRIKNYPAAVPGVVAVGSTDKRDQRSSFSNYGDWISVTAPGSDILSTFPLNQNMIGQTEYGSISGTSMATPFVAGLAALIKSKYPQLSGVEIKKVLEATADDKGNAGYDEHYGHGRVNVANALTKAEQVASGRLQAQGFPRR